MAAIALRGARWSFKIAGDRTKVGGYVRLRLAFKTCGGLVLYLGDKLGGHWLAPAPTGPAWHNLCFDRPGQWFSASSPLHAAAMIACPARMLERSEGEAGSFPAASYPAVCYVTVHYRQSSVAGVRYR
jgi:hypothetical protein